MNVAVLVVSAPDRLTTGQHRAGGEESAIYSEFAWADVYTVRFSRRYCGIPHVTERTLQVYSSVKIVTTFLIPLVITWISYCMIIYSSHATWKTVVYI